MRLLRGWIDELGPEARVLDLGCGPGSLREELAGRRVYGVDVDAGELGEAGRVVCGTGDRLPFAAGVFDLVVGHHSLEHVAELGGTLREVRRVLKPEGRLFVTVPDGGSFSDRLYRAALCGGGHVQRFTFAGLVAAVEGETGLRLAGWQKLYTSFVYLDRRGFREAPAGWARGPLPRRVRWLGAAPEWAWRGGRWALNWSARVCDRGLGTDLSGYGWAFAFGGAAGAAREEAGWPDVCMWCGAGVEAPRGVLCGRCGGRNGFWRWGRL